MIRDEVYVKPDVPLKSDIDRLAEKLKGMKGKMRFSWGPGAELLTEEERATQALKWLEALEDGMGREIKTDIEEGELEEFKQEYDAEFV